jgi:hypothetical protein
LQQKKKTDSEETPVYEIDVEYSNQERNSWEGHPSDSSWEADSDRVLRVDFPD